MVIFATTNEENPASIANMKYAPLVSGRCEAHIFCVQTDFFKGVEPNDDRTSANASCNLLANYKS